MKKYILSLILFGVCCATAQTATIQLALDDDNKEWIPTKNNSCDVTVTLTGAAPKSYVTFQLISTAWPGYCMNKGDPTDKRPDLRFVEANQSNVVEVNGKQVDVSIGWKVLGGAAEGQTITVRLLSDPIPPTCTLTLKVNCYDYGAIGKINAGLYTGGDENGPQYATAQVMIPYTTGQSYIAEAQKSKPGWVGWSGNDADDLERGPGGNTNDGDGLTAFEEYRGFEVNGKYRYTNPLEKDVFIHVDATLPGGIGWASHLPQDTNNTFKLHSTLKADEMGRIGSRVINSRACLPFFRMSQKAIYVRQSSEPTNKYGDAMGVAIQNYMPAQGPARHTQAIIYTEIIRDNVAVRNKGAIRKKDANTQIKKTTGHEIGHHLYLPEVIGIGRTVTFKYEGLENRTETATFSNRQGRSIMHQGLYLQDPERFASYHHDQYYMVPDTLRNRVEDGPAFSSTLPDFSPVFDTTNIPNYLSHDDTPAEGPCGHTYSPSEAAAHSVQSSCSTGTNCLSTNFYLCQHQAHEYAHACGEHPLSEPGDHSFQATCPWHRRCISTNFYMCQHTSHEYPSHLAVCGHPLPGHAVMPDHGCNFQHYSCQFGSMITRWRC